MQVSFFFVLPNILLSGFMFPRQAMPEVFQWMGLLLPLTHFLKVLRGILLKGVGLEALWQEGLVLAGVAALMIVLSVRRVRKTLDLDGRRVQFPPTRRSEPPRPFFPPPAP